MVTTSVIRDAGTVCVLLYDPSGGARQWALYVPMSASRMSSDPGGVLSVEEADARAAGVGGVRGMSLVLYTAGVV